MIELVPYSCLTRISARRDVYVQLLEAPLHRLLRSALASIAVDETWYRGRYQDVDMAIRAGKLQSAQEHFIEVGYFENRLPRKIIVDTKWYLDVYGDVADAVARGELKSAQEHFETSGYEEGRLPYPDWKL